MPPTADTSLGLRTSMTYTLTANTHGNDKTMRTVTMMSGDQTDHKHTNGYYNEAEKKSSKYDYYYKEPCFYTQRIYANAGKVFNALRQETREELENPYYQRHKNTNKSEKKVEIPDIDFEDDTEKRLTFELAFEALKYQRVFEDLLAECSFFVHFPECVEDQSLVMVVLWDYQNRKFQQRTPQKDEFLDPVVQQVEEAIIEYKTKLNASLARHRIKASAPSLEFLLPEKVRSQEDLASKLPVYVWVNNLKTSIVAPDIRRGHDGTYEPQHQKEALQTYHRINKGPTEDLLRRSISLDVVIGLFKDDHYTLIDAEDHLEGQVFYVDCHCTDMLVFPPDSREYILEHDLLHAGHIVMQDKSSCISPQTVKYLIGDDDDIIHVNAGSGVTTAHISSLMSSSSGHIWAFGANKGTALNKTMEKLGVKNIKFLQESFLNLEADDPRFKNVKVVLVTADCSKSGIANPIDFIVNEGEDMKILKDLSVGETDLTRLGELIGNHGALLKQAMKLQKVQAIVYMTRSVHEAENETVVTRAVEYINMIQQRKFPYRVVPPVLPFSGHDIENSIGICGKYIKFLPSEKNSGCFVTVITREPEDAKEATRDVIARAQAKGLLGGKKKEPKEKKPIPVQEQNGEILEEEEKLLQKRVKRAPRKLRAASSAPQYVNSYTKPVGHSIVRSQMFGGGSKSLQRGTKSTAAIGARLYATSTKTFELPEKKEKPPKVAEHLKVVKHPAPFR